MSGLHRQLMMASAMASVLAAIPRGLQVGRHRTSLGQHLRHRALQPARAVVIADGSVGGANAASSRRSRPRAPAGARGGAVLAEGRVVTADLIREGTRPSRKRWRMRSSRLDEEPDMLVDYARIHAIAGTAGSGCISFRREKYVPGAGPTAATAAAAATSFWRWTRTSARCSTAAIQPHLQRRRGEPAGNNSTAATARTSCVRVPPGTVVRRRRDAAR